MDWIGLNISGQVTRKQVERIAKYLLQNFGFKPTLSLGPDGKKETLFYNHENEHQVYFTIYKDSSIYHYITKIDFCGQNGY